MKASELKTKSKDELLDQLVEFRQEQFNLRMQQATGQMARGDQYRKVRRNIARVKTVLRAMEIEASKAEVG